jgi:hypothetical protein
MLSNRSTVTAILTLGSLLLIVFYNREQDIQCAANTGRQRRRRRDRTRVYYCAYSIDPTNRV